MLSNYSASLELHELKMNSYRQVNCEDQVLLSINPRKVVPIMTVIYSNQQIITAKELISTLQLSTNFIRVTKATKPWEQLEDLF